MSTVLSSTGQLPHAPRHCSIQSSHFSVGGRQRRDGIAMYCKACAEQHRVQKGVVTTPSRRDIMVVGAVAAATWWSQPSLAAIFESPPAGMHRSGECPQEHTGQRLCTGYRRHVDKLDGYTFVYPDSWIPVTVCRCHKLNTDCNHALPQTSGNDVFYRNPFNLDENVFVNITSPSSSKYATRERIP